MQALPPHDIISRYDTASAQVKAERGWRVMGSPGPPMTPYAPEYPDTQIFMGSHVDEDPSTEDKVEVWSSRRENGGEMMVREHFIQRNERQWFSSRPVLHHAAMLIRIPGGHYLDAVVTSIDLSTGEVIGTTQGGDAFHQIRKHALTEDAGQHNPPPNAWNAVPVPPLPPEPRPDPSEVVHETARGLEQKPGGVEVGEEAVQVGDNSVAIRS